MASQSKNKKSQNLRGSASSSTQALLLIDVINDLEFPGGKKLAKQSPGLARRLSALVRRARASGVPVIYINDNFQRWQSDFKKILAHCSRPKTKGFELSRVLKPEPQDYFILKPEKSAFYQTPLLLLLRFLKVKTLILTGLTTDSCIYITACDAHMRDYGLIVPRDCVAAIDPVEHLFFLKTMKETLKADIRPSKSIRLARIKRKVKPS